MKAVFLFDAKMSHQRSLWSQSLVTRCPAVMYLEYKLPRSIPNTRRQHTEADLVKYEQVSIEICTWALVRILNDAVTVHPYIEFLSGFEPRTGTPDSAVNLTTEP